MNFVAKSWQAVKEVTIFYSFRKAVILLYHPGDDDDEDFTSDTLEVTNGSECNDIDAELPGCGESNELDYDIVETISPEALPSSQ